MTQGDPLSPIIFNVIVDAVVRCLRAKAPFESLRGLFYADDGWLASHDPMVAQNTVDSATDLFRRMGRQMNAAKTKTMHGHPGNEVHAIASPAFARRLTGIGETYLARKRRMVSCDECGKLVQERNLAKHLVTQHNIYQRPPKRRKILDTISEDPVSYSVDLPPHSIVNCPVVGCNGRAGTRDSMRMHFAHRHPHDTIVIEQEGPLPRCEQCDMFVPYLGLRSSYPASKRCAVGTER